MFLGSITYLFFMMCSIAGLFIIIGLFTLCWMGIVQIIKLYERRMRTQTQANQVLVPLINSVA